MLFNQAEVDSKDQHIWRNERSDLISRLRQLCNKNSIVFTTDTGNILANKKNVAFWPGDLLNPYEYYQELNKICSNKNAILFVLTDNFITFEDLEFVRFHSDPKLHFLFCSFSNDAKTNLNPSKLYNCFIQRVCSVRQSWFYFLYLRQLLDKGYVSFLLKQLRSYSELTGIALFDFIHSKYELGNVPKFEEAYNLLRPMVPYCNFIENADLAHYIADSKYSLVLETYATDPATDRWFVGEKAIRALCFPAVPLLFVQTGTVEKLRTIGFEIDYHDQIDNLNWVDRQRCLLDLLENDAIDTSYKHNYNRAMHNRAIGSAGKHRFQNSDYFDEFITKVLEH